MNTDVSKNKILYNMQEVVVNAQYSFLHKPSKFSSQIFQIYSGLCGKLLHIVKKTINLSLASNNEDIIVYDLPQALV